MTRKHRMSPLKNIDIQILAVDYAIALLQRCSDELKRSAAKKKQHPGKRPKTP